MPTAAPIPAARNLDGPTARQLLETACEAAGARLVASRLRSVHHRPGRSVSHVHEATLQVEGQDREVLLVAHADARELPPEAFVLGRGGDRVAVWRFPHDPFLPGLPSAIAPDRVREMLDGLGAPPGEVLLHTRAYRPARRAVVEVRLHGGPADGRIIYFKVLVGDRAGELAAVHRTLGAAVPVPRVVGVAATQGILAIEALPGRTLAAALGQGDPLPDPGALVDLSRRIASTDLRTRRDPRAFADPVRHVGMLADLVPDRASTLTDVAAAAASFEAPLVGVHGDLHGGQLLLEDGEVTGLLDVDGAGTGWMAQDAGNLVAHLEVLGEVRPELADRAGTYAAAVADAYRPVVGATPLARATAGAWIGLATGPHRSQDEDWPERTRRRIDKAAAVLRDR